MATQNLPSLGREGKRQAREIDNPDMNTERASVPPKLPSVPPKLPRLDYRFGQGHRRPAGTARFHLRGGATNLEMKRLSLSSDHSSDSCPAESGGLAGLIHSSVPVARTGLSHRCFSKVLVSN